MNITPAIDFLTPLNLVWYSNLYWTIRNLCLRYFSVTYAVCNLSNYQRRGNTTAFQFKVTLFYWKNGKKKGVMTVPMFLIEPLFNYIMLTRNQFYYRGNWQLPLICIHIPLSWLVHFIFIYLKNALRVYT